MFFSCKQNDSGPQKAITGFLLAMSKDNINAARNYTTQESSTNMALCALMLGKENSLITPSGFEPDKFDIGQPRFKKDTAFVPIKIKSSKHEFECMLYKEGDDWKVNVTLEFLGNFSALITLKDIISDGVDSLKQSLEELDKIQLPELEEGMEIIKTPENETDIESSIN
jgi:hypothetical protein